MNDQDEITHLKNTIVDLTSQLQQMENEKYQLEQLFQEQNENLRNLHNQQNNHLQLQLDKILHDRSILQEDNKTLRQKIMIEINLRKKSELLYEDLKNKCSEITDNQDNAQSRLVQKQDEAKHLALYCEQQKNEIVIQKRKISQLEDQVDNLKVELDVQKGQNEQMKDDGMRNREKLKVFGQENAKLRQEIEILQQQKQKASELIQEYKQEIENLQLDQKKKNNDDHLKVQLERANQEINRYKVLMQQSPNVKTSQSFDSLPAQQQYQPGYQHGMFNQYDQQPQFESQQQQQQPQLYLPQYNNYDYDQQYNPPQQIHQLPQFNPQIGQYNLPSNNQQMPQYHSPDKHLQNVQIQQQSQNELVHLQQKKEKIDGDLRKCEQQRVRSTNQRKHRQFLENELDTVTKQIQDLKKSLRNR